MKKLFVLFIAVAGFGLSSYAQSTVSTFGYAVIVTPIALTKTADLRFGNVAVSATIAGSVTIDQEGVRHESDGVTLPVVTGIFNAAKFTLTGEGNYTFGISTTATELVLSDGLGHSLTVNTLSFPATGALTSGAGSFSVGAKLNVPAGSTAGDYKNETGFPITVNYN